MTKRIFGSFVGVALIVALWGCKTVQKTPAASPNAVGCSVTAQALGYTLVSAMSWTNISNGDHGSGSTVHPECGSTLTVIADPSVSCSTNAPILVAVSFACGTNTPPAPVALQLPANCYGFTCTINCSCSNCTFSVSPPNGSAFSCNDPVLRPRQ